MIHVPDWKQGLEWYAKAFPQAQRVLLPEFDFECLELNGIRIEVVKADAKVGAGTFGLAVDWKVEFTSIPKTALNTGREIELG